jgi:hypothetical protein
MFFEPPKAHKCGIPKDSVSAPLSADKSVSIVHYRAVSTSSPQFRDPAPSLISLQCENHLVLNLSTVSGVRQKHHHSAGLLTVLHLAVHASAEDSAGYPARLSGHFHFSVFAASHSSKAPVHFDRSVHFEVD